MTSNINLALLESKLDMIKSDYLFDSGYDQEMNQNDYLAAKPDQKLLLNHFNKNVLFVCITYLKSHQIFSLVKSSKKIYKKLISDPYFNFLTTESFSLFFSQQFSAPTQDYIERMHSMASQSTAQTLNSLGKPIGKNDTFEPKIKIYSLNKDTENSYFDKLFEEPVHFSSEEALTIQNQKIERVAKEFSLLYERLIEKKQQIGEAYHLFFSTKYSSNPRSFSRELLLDPSEQLTSGNLEDMINQNQNTIRKNLIIFTIFQFQSLAQAHRLEIERRMAKIGSQPFQIIDVFNDLFSHLKVLIKKISGNVVVTDSFKEYLISEGYFIEENFKEHLYISDMLLMNILEQLWIREFYEPLSNNILHYLKQEIYKTHDIERFDDLMCKRTSLQKLIKIMKHNDQLQQEKSQYRQLVHLMDSSKTFQYLQATEIVESSILRVFDQVFQATNSLTEFCQELKHYQQTKFLMPEFKKYYYQNKGLFVLKSFSKDLHNRLNDSSISQLRSHSKDYTYFTLIPQYLQGTLFFQLVLSLSKDENIKLRYSHESFKAALFNIFYIEGNFQWALKLNNALLRCHQNLEGNRENYRTSFPMEEEFEDTFIRVCEGIEKNYDFESEIKIRKQRLNEQIIRDIQERLLQIKSNPKLAPSKIGMYPNKPFNFQQSNNNNSGMFRS